MKSGLSCVGAILLAGGSAFGQLNGFDVIVDHEVSPAHPSTEVEVWARFDPQYSAFAYSAFKVKTSKHGADEGFWPAFNCEVEGLYSSPGTLADDGSDVVGVLPGQEFLEPVLPDFSNPILLWRGEWTTKDFSERMIRVDIIPLWFNVYVSDEWFSPQKEILHSEEWQNTPGFISVVPAPGAGAVGMGAIALVNLRRRRR